ncbi:hypothetical protein P7266_1122 [Lactococcus cremoris]|nr:hypothetical protein P7266_1122 [Lactococcus cremoris]
MSLLGGTSLKMLNGRLLMAWSVTFEFKSGVKPRFFVKK